MPEDINITVALMQEDIKHTKDAIERVEVKFDEANGRLEKKLDSFIEASSKRFSAKWVERTLTWFLFTIAALIIAYTFTKFVGGTLSIK